MINGVAKTEKEYRKIPLDSSSSLKDFCLDRRKYFRKYCLNEVIEEKDTQALTMGSVVDCLLLEPDLFDEKFYLSACANPPTGMMLDFVEALYKYTKECINSEGEITRTFEEIAKDAHRDSGYKISLDRVLNNFVGGDAEIYYNEILQVRTKGLTVITANDIMNAEKIVEELKTNRTTSQIVNLETGGRWKVFNQWKQEEFLFEKHKFKSMIDKLLIDTATKRIFVYDLKCVWNPEQFYEDYYLYRRAYLQAYLYYVAAQTLLDTEEYEDYTVMPPAFIVCDSTNYYSPLIYQMHWQDLQDAYDGFEHKGRKYVGIRELVLDLDWALENNIWNISRKNYELGGIINLKG